MITFNNILGYLIIFIHYVVFNFLALYAIFFAKNFYLDMFFLLIFYIICAIWYVMNECPLTAIEQYLLNDKREKFNEKKYKKFYFFGKRYVIFDFVTNNGMIFFNVCGFIIFFIKILYSILNKIYTIPNNLYDKKNNEKLDNEQTIKLDNE